MKKAFTLVELIIVVIIIGILASIAIPQFNKTMERSRIAEASAVLGALRGAQLRYILENPSGYAIDLTKLDIEPPNYDGVDPKNDGKFFLYSADNTVENNFTSVATAQRKSSQYGQYTLKINDQGKIYCADTVTTDACAGFVSQ